MQVQKRQKAYRIIQRISMLLPAALAWLQSSPDGMMYFQLQSRLAWHGVGFLRKVTHGDVLKSRKAEAAREAEATAAVCIQAHARGYLLRCYVGDLRHVLHPLLAFITETATRWRRLTDRHLRVVSVHCAGCHQACQHDLGRCAAIMLSALQQQPRRAWLVHN